MLTPNSLRCALQAHGGRLDRRDSSVPTGVGPDWGAGWEGAFLQQGLWLWEGFAGLE